MPLFDFACERCGAVEEHFIPLYGSPNPACACGGGTVRLVSAANIVWTKPLGAYGGKNPDGQFVYRTRSTRHADGTPEKVFLRTRQEQREYCKQEGLRMPDEINPNAHVDSTGRKLATAGMPGQWV